MPSADGLPTLKWQTLKHFQPLDLSKCPLSRLNAALFTYVYFDPPEHWKLFDVCDLKVGLYRTAHSIHLPGRRMYHYYEV